MEKGTTSPFDVSKVSCNGMSEVKTYGQHLLFRSSPQPRKLEDESNPDESISATIGLNFNIPWMIGLSSRNQELCKWFSIPSTEILVDDFNCALRKRVLLQGRIFIFENYVCFNSNVFGYCKKKVFHIPDIEVLKRTSNFRIPNSIEIVTSNGRAEFFTNFLARETAFRLILSLCQQARPGHDFSALDDDEATMRGGHCHRLSSADPGDLSLESNVVVPDMQKHVEMPRVSAGNLIALDAEEDGAEEDEDEKVWKCLVSGPVPKRLPDSKLLLTATLPGTTKDIFDFFLSNKSHLIEDVLEQMGNRRINVESWKRTQILGHVRDVQFIAPIKGAFSNWGVSETKCHQSHRICRYSDDYIVFETSQTMSDIPYGDCFTVEKRWDIRPAPDAPPSSPTLLVDVHLRVPFSRTCFFKKIIEMGTVSQSKEMVSQLVEALQQALLEHFQNVSAADPATLSMRSQHLSRLVNEAAPSQHLTPFAAPDASAGLLCSTSHGMVHSRPRHSLSACDMASMEEIEPSSWSPSRRLPFKRPGYSLGAATSTVSKGHPSLLQRSCRMLWKNALMLLLIALFIAWQLYLIHLIYRLPQGMPSALPSDSVNGQLYGSGSPYSLEASGPTKSSVEAGKAACEPDSLPGHDRTYLVQRIHLMDQQVKLLQVHMESVSSELKAVLKSLDTPV
ncbi:hypothetical protein CEUSTIGMA_g6894.t1 [Chlamydomonas eustigma]|uniref:VASt domain-containing protein n=1 Tax=Chlamydomonas eustigma TaxID=1157962 RepID=A0A250X8Q5_9CHLO|nr:hypothetical protein CEUSTIGMA_g6894.t1 [Chlamydomonas eustigma]|eukprot:GAX79453.1 hypothetical protein CEUSTIGMA_g6894.t1 [Chlamydomonas eustigma]